MSRILRHIVFLMLPLASGCGVAHAAETSLQAALSKLAPNANPKVIGLALAATECATAQGQPPSDRLAIIDYSKPSTEPRLWVFDLSTRKLLYRELVAHGRNTGDNLATKFSNTLESLQSSLGLFRTLGTYAGHNGYSLRMQGLEPGTNDNALERALVIHGASYVNPALAKMQGRIGRSYGCPAVRTAIARPLIDALKGGQYVFSYFPDAHWLKTSPYLKCTSARAMTASINAH
ncbi:murein L,D-transpeptidase catalytic domain family protein [Rhodanobacter ginsengiterrae]|uniref:murein L,D-transpeptidase catalytic domain family protein n=1 Tax=Rhodanobacter ginsengiterrae TaxID=2008451 RepID=UPI003CF34855